MTPEIAGILASFATGLLMAVANWLLGRRRQTADVAQIQAAAAAQTTETALSLIGPLHEEVENLRAQNEQFRRDMQHMRAQVEVLADELARVTAERDSLRARVVTLEAEAAERDGLRARIVTLEAEVAELRSERQPRGWSANDAAS